MIISKKKKKKIQIEATKNIQNVQSDNNESPQKSESKS